MTGSPQFKGNCFIFTNNKGGPSGLKSTRYITRKPAFKMNWFKWGRGARASASLDSQGDLDLMTRNGSRWLKVKALGIEGGVSKLEHEYTCHTPWALQLLTREENLWQRRVILSRIHCLKVPILLSAVIRNHAIATEWGKIQPAVRRESPILRLKKRASIYWAILVESQCSGCFGCTIVNGQFW